MYPKGTKIYDQFGELYATLTVDVVQGDPFLLEQFEFHQHFLLPPQEGDTISDPLRKMSEGRPYPPKE